MAFLPSADAAVSSSRMALENPAPRAHGKAFEAKIDDEAGDGRQGKVGEAELDRTVGHALEGARNETDAKWPAGDRLEVEGDEVDRHRDAESGNGEVVGSKAQRDRSHRQRDEAGKDCSAQPSGENGQPETAEMGSRGRRRHDRRGIGPDGDEAGDAHIEEAGHAPLQVQAEAYDGEGKGRRQEESCHRRGGPSSCTAPE